MGKRDIVIKNWLSDKVRFADLCNGVLFQGKSIVKPLDLELIQSESDIIVRDKNKKDKFVQRFHDIVMRILLKAEKQLEQLSDGQRGGVNMCKALEDLYQDGVQQGIQQGKMKGESWLSQLTLILLREKKYEELERVSTDSSYRERMYQEYNIAEKVIA